MAPTNGSSSHMVSVPSVAPGFSGARIPHMVRTIARPPTAMSTAAMTSTVQRAPDEAMPVPVLADAVPVVARSTARPAAQMAGTEGRGTWARIVTSGPVTACNSSLKKAPCRI